jgi:hypothetical protein
MAEERSEEAPISSVNKQPEFVVPLKKHSDDSVRKYL